MESAFDVVVGCAVCSAPRPIPVGEMCGTPRAANCADALRHRSGLHHEMRSNPVEAARPRPSRDVAFKRERVAGRGLAGDSPASGVPSWSRVCG